MGLKRRVTRVFSFRRKSGQEIYYARGGVARSGSIGGIGRDGAAQARSFKNGKNQFLCGSWIRRAFENDQLSGTKMLTDGIRCIAYVGQIRFPVLVQWCWDADNDRIHLFETFKSCSGLKAVTLPFGCYNRGGNVLYIGFSGLQFLNLNRICIKSSRPESIPCVKQRERQPNITQSNDSYLDLL